MLLDRRRSSSAKTPITIVTDWEATPKH